MHYLYGEFSEKQINYAVRNMHNDVHKLLLYKDNEIIEKFFKNDDEFLTYFKNLLFRFGGLNKLLGEPQLLVSLMSTLQAAYDMAQSQNFNYKMYRHAILDCHGYIKLMFESDESEVD